MPAKGVTNNPNGRPKGSKNEKTLMWEQLGEYITQQGAEKATRILHTMEEEDFMRHYLMMLEYFKPKQARTTIVGDSEAPIQIIISDKI